MEEYRARYVSDEEMEGLRRDQPFFAGFLEERRWVIEVRGLDSALGLPRSLHDDEWGFYGCEPSQARANERVEFLLHGGERDYGGQHRKPEYEQGDRRSAAGKGGHYDVIKQIGDVGGVIEEGMLTDPRNVIWPDEQLDLSAPTRSTPPDIPWPPVPGEKTEAVPIVALDKTEHAKRRWWPGWGRRRHRR